jgi:hypothetical protein
MKKGNATDRTTGTEPICVCWILRTIRTDMVGDSLIAGTQLEMKIKTPRQETGMVLLFSSGIDRQGPLFSCYQVQQKDTYRLRLISSYGGWRVCERGSNTPPRHMEQHNDKRRISHQTSKRVGAINGRPPHIRSILLFFTCRPQPTYQSLQEVVPDDPIQPIVAENAFVQVILMFRRTFIQDSALRMEIHPCYPIWHHTIFSDPAYLSFKR